MLESTYLRIKFSNAKIAFSQNAKICYVTILVWTSFLCNIKVMLNLKQVFKNFDNFAKDR